MVACCISVCLELFIAIGGSEGADSGDSTQLKRHRRVLTARPHREWGVGKESKRVARWCSTVLVAAQAPIVTWCDQHRKFPQTCWRSHPLGAAPRTGQRCEFCVGVPRTRSCRGLASCGLGGQGERRWDRPPVYIGPPEFTDWRTPMEMCVQRGLRCTGGASRSFHCGPHVLCLERALSASALESRRLVKKQGAHRLRRGRPSSPLRSCIKWLCSGDCVGGWIGACLGV